MSLNAQPISDRDNIINYNSPKEYVIGGLLTEGVDYFDDEIVKTLSGLYEGKRIEIPGDDISSAIKRLWKQGLFGNVEISITQIIGNKVFLKIKLQELPKISYFYFKGLRKAEQDDLRDKLGLVKGRVLTPGIKSDVEATVESFLIDKGYMRAKCNTIQKNDTTFKNGVALEINVNKGSKIKINRIFFEGNKSVSDRQLKKMMRETKEASRFTLIRPKQERIADNKKTGNITLKNRIENLSLSSIMDELDKHVKFRLLNSSRFIKKDYITDRNGLLQAFFDKGYRDAAIIYDTLYNHDERKIDIKINIEEGNQYRFRNVIWRGNTKYKTEELNQLVGIRKGDLYNNTLLETRLRMDPNSMDITSKYMDDGYLFFNLNTEEVIVAGDSIDLIINIYEGAQAIVNKVTINGNTKTNEEVIRREIRSRPGNKFSRSDIIRSQREIVSLGFFNPETIQINPTPHPEKGTVDIEYIVEEKSSDQAEFAAGYAGKDSYGRQRFNIALGVTFNNFSLKNTFRKSGWDPIPAGDGEALSFRINTTGANAQYASISYSKPWFGGRKPNSLYVSSYLSYVSYGLTRGSEKYQHLFTTGGTIGFGWRMKYPDDAFVLRLDLNFQNYNLKNYQHLLEDVSNGSFNNPNLKFTIARNQTNEPLFPSSGANFVFSWQPSIPLSYMPWNRNVDYANTSKEKKYKWIEYHKTRLNVDWYTSLTRNNKLVVKSAFKAGYVGYFNKEYGFTPFDLYEIGDVTNNQSFGIQGRDFIQLRGYETSLTDNYNGIASNSGFNIFNKYTVELRYLFSANPNSKIFGLIFTEAANGWHNMRDYNPFQLKRSAGIGMRFFLPMIGIIGIDYGVRFDKYSPYEAPIDRTGNLFEYMSRYGHINFMLGFEPE